MASLFLGSLAEVRELIVEADQDVSWRSVAVIPRACAGEVLVGQSITLQREVSTSSTILCGARRDLALESGNPCVYIILCKGSIAILGFLSFS
jgi:hypothetical protein